MTPPAGAAAQRARPLPRPTARPRTRTAPVYPRRVSGPVHAPAKRPVRPTQPPPDAHGGLALGALRAARSLAGHRLLDRLIRGRAWIALIAFALIGIVTLQLLVLALNARIGRALVREGNLQRENAALSIEGSELAAGERVEAQAARLGMQLVPIGSLRFLTADPPADLARAAAALDAPVHGAPATSAASGAAPATSVAGEGGGAQEANAASAPSATGAPASQATTTGASGESTAASAAAATAAAQGATQATSAGTGTTAGAPAASVGVGAADGEGTPASSAGGVGAPDATQTPGSG